eukprot:TRINITY_DN658_c0_g1_i1.p1 TRINITY_DN658_c0_g1~~TRINITY_DN658_c0_g1_i1.p1  ORF type:complete len:263 (-),score=81.84 TRINITY_DN658_c0_g1_i1:59-847(-)
MADWAAAKADIIELLSHTPCHPILVRLAWHDAGCYCAETQTGGAHALMNHESVAAHGGNAGLNIARDLLLPIRSKYPDISCADFWQFAACVAIEAAGGPHVTFRSGRTDLTEDSVTPDGRLPDATQGENHLRAVFGRMGFNDQEIVALSGAHTLGSCHKDRSGFEGPWTTAPKHFDNTYFTELFGKTWVPKEGSDPLQYEDEETKELMMLPSDMALLADEAMREVAQRYADSEEVFFTEFAAAFQKLQELGTPDSELTVVEY